MNYTSFTHPIHRAHLVIIKAPGPFSIVATIWGEFPRPRRPLDGLQTCTPDAWRVRKVATQRRRVRRNWLLEVFSARNASQSPFFRNCIIHASAHQKTWPFMTGAGRLRPRNNLIKSADMHTLLG